MRVLVFALSMLLLTSLTWADTVPRYDISKLKPYLRVEHDGKNHYLVRVDRSRVPRGLRLPRPLFYGNGKVFYEVPYRGSSANKSDFSYTTNDPRSIPPLAFATYRRKKGISEMACDDRKTGLTPLSEVESQEMVAKAQFHRVYWRRAAYLLARNDEGRYFFVDRLYDSQMEPRYWRRRHLIPKRGFRLYVGLRGRMKRVKLTNIVADPAGEVLTSKIGRFKRVAAKKRITWIEKGKITELTSLKVDTAATRMLIYQHLGPYRGARFRRPCDDM
ncbi:MAG: hypothetical protein JRH20_28810 [Deltaproteobacteria bacterium]|nr:hypothetical protein [Deltaproteobacteria bacterium]